MLVYRRMDPEEKKESKGGEAAQVPALASDSSRSTPEERPKSQHSVPTVTAKVDSVAGRNYENLEQEADIEQRSDKKMKV